MKRVQERHELLENLQTLSSQGSSSEERLKLVGKMFQTDLSIIEDCMLQVTHVCVTQPNPEIQQHLNSFLLWLAGNSLMLALKISWTIDAITDFFIASGMSDQIKKIHDRIETVAINQDRQLPAPWDKLAVNGGAGRRGGSPVTQDDQPDADVVMRKEQRLKLYNDQRAFVSFLTDLSNQLRFFSDRPKRKIELRKRLAEVNEHLSSLRLIHPLCRSNDHVRWIVRITVEECTVFSSRERAPYLIRYEVIVDDTATLADPSQSRLRQKDGSFKVSSASQDVYVPGANLEENSSNHSGEERERSPRGKSRSHGTGGAPPNEFLQNAFGESAEERLARIRRESPWGAHPNWTMNSMIVKAGDDLRQEELALQLIYMFDRVWSEAGLTCRAHPYVALPTSSDSGLLEVVENSNSMDGIKKASRVSSIYQFFTRAFDGENSKVYLEMQRNFAETLAGYSIISYILQIKDRHNGNLMIVRTGELVHIDFGFFFVTSPGGLNFESAPFKLSQELIDVLGGVSGDAFNYYKVILYQGLEAARERAEDLLALISLMVPYNSMPCFGADPVAVVAQVRNRFRYDLFSEADFALYTKDLVTNSADNWRTRRYDQFQTLQNGIL